MNVSSLWYAVSSLKMNIDAVRSRSNVVANVETSKC